MPNFQVEYPSSVDLTNTTYTYHFDIVNSAAPTYFVPAQLMPQLKQCQESMSNLDAMNIQQQQTDEDGGECSDNGNNRRESLINMNLVAVNPGDEIELKGINYGSKTR